MGSTKAAAQNEQTAPLDNAVEWVEPPRGKAAVGDDSAKVMVSWRSEVARFLALTDEEFAGLDPEDLAPIHAQIARLRNADM